jgi:hypothetical protein
MVSGSEGKDRARMLVVAAVRMAKSARRLDNRIPGPLPSFPTNYFLSSQPRLLHWYLGRNTAGVTLNDAVEVIRGVIQHRCSRWLVKIPVTDQAGFI